MYRYNSSYPVCIGSSVQVRILHYLNDDDCTVLQTNTEYGMVNRLQ